MWPNTSDSSNYFYAYIHLMFKHTVLGTSLLCNLSTKITINKQQQEGEVSAGLTVRIMDTCKSPHQLKKWPVTIHNF